MDGKPAQCRLPTCISSDLLDCFLGWREAHQGWRVISKDPAKDMQHFIETSCNINCWIMLWGSWPNACNTLQHPKMLQQKFDYFQTWFNTIKHLATCCYRVSKLMQHFACNSVTRCCFEMLSVFDWALRIQINNLAMQCL